MTFLSWQTLKSGTGSIRRGKNKRKGLVEGQEDKNRTGQTAKRRHPHRFRTFKVRMLDAGHHGNIENRQGQGG